MVTIFILALALILQAITVFTQLRKHNTVADRTELITAQDLVDAISPPVGTPPTAARTASKWCWSRKTIGGLEMEIVERRLLRHLFLRRFGLPQLFPFSKYLRRAQANQISHMIEVEPSMWVLLLFVAWLICGFVSLLEHLNVELPESEELVEVIVSFAWTLVALHIAALLYFRSCLHRVLKTAGYSDDDAVLPANLRAIAQEEAVAWRNEAADNSFDTMNRVQEELEEVEARRHAERHAILRKDVGLQLAVTCCRNLKMGGDVKPREASGVQTESPEIHIPFFSRKTWHVIVIFHLVLNGFFIALLVQCAVYDRDVIYGEFGLLPTLMVPLPLALNTLVFQQRISSYFVIVCSIFRVNANTLGEVVNHFSEIVELRSEFAASVLASLKEDGSTIE
ncbi:hypothetical protein PInf_001727 [Phytophthora infestans]|nr:hypothetical protein PInf_001727 [Phytophthora infestans]